PRVGRAMGLMVGALCGLAAVGASTMTWSEAKAPRVGDDRQDGAPSEILIVVDIVTSAPPETPFRVGGEAHSTETLRQYLERYGSKAKAEWRDATTRLPRTKVLIRGTHETKAFLVLEVLDVCARELIADVSMMDLHHPESRQALTIPADGGLEPEEGGDAAVDLLELALVLDEVNQIPVLLLGEDGIPATGFDYPAKVTQGLEALAQKQVPDLAEVRSPAWRFVLAVDDQVGCASLARTITVLRTWSRSTLSFRRFSKAMDLSKHLVPDLIRSATDTMRQGAVQQARDWLRAQQSKDGGWPGVSSGKLDGMAAGRCGLAILALLGSATMGEPLPESIRRGVDCLIDQQDESGRFVPEHVPSSNYSQAVAVLALSEVAILAPEDAALRTALVGGVREILQCQNPYKGWRYGRATGDNDSSVTSWMLIALSAARRAGVQIDQRSREWGLGVLQELTDDATGRTGYTKRGELPVRNPGTVHRFPPVWSENLTSASIVARRLHGVAADDASIQRGLQLILDRPPHWDDAAEHVDMCYWYFGRLALALTDARGADEWKARLHRALLDHQVADGED
ncbi:MAG: terpene cyclase/mutase family protein, partial [Planctomycetes bacterium]|nr:terpene cyclase/mutase family protein [Planctomycetota bacterium]